MKQNEKGYVLVLVLVTMAALAVLALAAIQVNLATNKQANIRINETQLDVDVKSTLNLLVADLKGQFPLHLTDEVPAYMESQQAFQQAVDHVLVTNETYSGDEVSGESAIVYSITRSPSDRTDAPFTTALTLQVTGTSNPKAEFPDQTITYTQDVYLTALPSFLYYVLGSDDQLTVNGPPRISGNVYVGQHLDLQRDAYYRLDNVQYTLSNSPTSRFYLDGNIDLSSSATCDGCDEVSFFATSMTPSADDAPTIGYGESAFSAFNFDYSVIQYANRFKDTSPKFDYTDAPSDTLFNQGLLPIASSPFLEQTYTASGDTAPLTRYTEYLDQEKLDAIQTLQVIEPPISVTSPMIISESIASSQVPLLFDGDVAIEAIDTITIQRPLIVNGNLTIRGDVAFNTTVYTLNEAFIDRANILTVSSSQNSSLVLLTKGKILLNRIDAFESASQPLQAFMYSDSSEKSYVYAVGSTLHVKGGIYSKGPLEVNTFRGTFQSLPDGSAKSEYFRSVNHYPVDTIATSRLHMQYNEDVFQQIDTLPVTNQLQLFVGQKIKQ